jgi:hypothetical protein
LLVHLACRICRAGQVGTFQCVDGGSGP